MFIYCQLLGVVGLLVASCWLGVLPRLRLFPEQVPGLRPGGISSTARGSRRCADRDFKFALCILNFSTSQKVLNPANLKYFEDASYTASARDPRSSRGQAYLLTLFLNTFSLMPFKISSSVNLQYKISFAPVLSRSNTT